MKWSLLREEEKSDNPNHLGVFIYVVHLPDRGEKAPAAARGRPASGHFNETNIFRNRPSVLETYLKWFLRWRRRAEGVFLEGGFALGAPTGLSGPIRVRVTARFTLES